MKRILIILILSIFVFHIGGYFAIFKYQQWKLWDEIEHLSKNKVKLKVSKFFFAQNKLRGGKEIQVGKGLYDIINYSDLGDSIELIAVLDKKEIALIDGYSLKLKANQEQNKKNDGNGIKFKSINLLLEENHFAFHKIESTLFYSFYGGKTSSGYLGFDPHPPRNV